MGQTISRLPAGTRVQFFEGGQLIATGEIVRDDKTGIRFKSDDGKGRVDEFVQAPNGEWSWVYYGLGDEPCVNNDHTYSIGLAKA